MWVVGEEPQHLSCALRVKIRHEETDVAVEECVEGGGGICRLLPDFPAILQDRCLKMMVIIAHQEPETCLFL